MDYNLIKDLKKLREKADKRKAEQKFPIVCDHVLFAKEPFSIKVVILWVAIENRHPKHDGRMFLCDGCALLVDNMKLSQADLLKFHVMEEKRFRANIQSTIER